MIEPEIAKRRWVAECLCASRKGSLLFVGQIPEPVRDHPIDGIRLHQVDNLDQAVALQEQLHGCEQSTGNDVLTLVLRIDPTQKQSASLLGHAIRAFPHRVVVYCTAAVQSPYTVTELFFSLGFRRLHTPPDLSVQPDDNWWFEYQMSQYKSAPEWLNARYWANPERFAVQEDPDAFSEYSDEEEE